MTDCVTKFEKMHKTPLYKARCKTFAIARKITGSGFVTTTANHPFHGFACLPKYRMETGKKLRQEVYNYIILAGRKNI